MQFSASNGGNSFAAIDAKVKINDKGFFVAAGINDLPKLGVSVGQSSRSTDVNLSGIPQCGLPVFVNLVAADVCTSHSLGRLVCSAWVGVTA